MLMRVSPHSKGLIGRHRQRFLYGLHFHATTVRNHRTATARNHGVVIVVHIIGLHGHHLLAKVTAASQHMRLEPRLQKSALLLGGGSGVVRWSWASPPNSSKCRIDSG